MSELDDIKLLDCESWITPEGMIQLHMQRINADHAEVFLLSTSQTTVLIGKLQNRLIALLIALRLRSNI